MTTHYEKLKKWRRATKERIIESFGSSCGICEYHRSKKALELHHLDPSKKDPSFSKWITKCPSWEKTVIELRKCVLLCANCHREVHDEDCGLVVPSNIRKYDEAFTFYKGKSKLFDDCPVCGEKKKIKNKTCSLQCSGKLKNKVDWDSINLEAMLKEHGGNKSAVGDLLGISGVAVLKRLKKIQQASSIVG